MFFVVVGCFVLFVGFLCIFVLFLLLFWGVLFVCFGCYQNANNMNVYNRTSLSLLLLHCPSPKSV